MNRQVIADKPPHMGDCVLINAPPGSFGPPSLQSNTVDLIETFANKKYGSTI